MNKAIFADSYCPYPLGTICDSLRASNRTLGFLVSVVLPGEPTGLLYGTHILVSSHKIGKGAAQLQQVRCATLIIITVQQQVRFAYFYQYIICLLSFGVDETNH